jgi:hypothetical protein
MVDSLTAKTLAFAGVFLTLINLSILKLTTLGSDDFVVFHKNTPEQSVALSTF